MDVSPATLAKQISTERRFNCVVCLCARFQMVYGRCQHRICTKCAYGSSGALRRQFHRCPSCQQEDAFPDKKPTIPEDNIELQKLLGVTVCENKGCTQEFWSWEKPEHDLTCPYKNSPRRFKRYSDARENQSTTTPKSTSRTQHARSTPKRAYPLRSRDDLSNTKLSDSGYHFRKRPRRSRHANTPTR